MQELEQIKKTLEMSFEEFKELEELWILLELDEYFNENFINIEKQMLFHRIKNEARKILRLQEVYDEIKSNIFDKKMDKVYDEIAKEYKKDSFIDLKQIEDEEEIKKIRNRIEEKRKEFENTITIKEIEQSLNDYLEDIQAMRKLISKGYKIEISELPKESFLRKYTSLIEMDGFNFIEELIKDKKKHINKYKNIKENLVSFISYRLDTLLPIARKEKRKYIKEDIRKINIQKREIEEKGKSAPILENKLDELDANLKDLPTKKVNHRKKANDFLKEFGLGLNDAEVEHISSNITKKYKDLKITKEYENYLKSKMKFSN